MAAAAGAAAAAAESCMTAVMSAGSADLYLELLKRSLTDTLFEEEPHPDKLTDSQYILCFADHYIRGRAVTMLPLARLDNLRLCIETAIREDVPGDIIETGVWRGGAMIFARGILEAHGVSDRVVWVADSFEGLPKPDAERFPNEAKAHAGVVMSKVFGHFAASLEDVQRNFGAYRLLDERVRFLKGWFKDTLPHAPIECLAVMRLDGDYYDSTRDALVHLYPRLAPGGFVIIDDFGEDTWTYCRKAVDEYRTEHGIDEPMIQVDSRCWYWRRAR
jgi:O-methyltransferase